MNQQRANSRQGLGLVLRRHRVREHSSHPENAPQNFLLLLQVARAGKVEINKTQPPATGGGPQGSARAVPGEWWGRCWAQSEFPASCSGTSPGSPSEAGTGDGNASSHGCAMSVASAECFSWSQFLESQLRRHVFFNFQGRKSVLGSPCSRKFTAKGK